MKPLKLKLLSAATMALCFSLAPVAQATTLSNYLTLDGPEHGTLVSGAPFQGGGEDKLQDDSLSRLIDLGAVGYSVGDIIYGMITLSDIYASNTPGSVSLTNDQVVILFSAKISSLTGGSNGSIQLAPIGDTTNAYDLRTLLTANDAGVTNDTIAVFLSSTVDPVGAADALNTTVAGFTNEFSNVTTPGKWSLEMVVGLLGGDDFFEFVPNAVGALTGTDRGVFSVQQSAFAVKEWAPVDAQNYAGVVKKGDVTLDFGTVTLANEAQQANGWTFSDQSTFYTNPIPEPGTLALLGMGLLGMGMGLRRRKA